MQLGLIGLGKMGGAMAERWTRGGHEVVAYTRGAESAQRAQAAGARPAADPAALCGMLKTPRTIWLMVPAGSVGEVVETLLPHLSQGDTLIDGGNSYYKDSVARGKYLEGKGIRFMDCGTSGGVWGLKNGYCLMIGADPELFARHEPIFRTLAPPDGYGRMGAVGAGHLVKMVHNGVEYGMMQAYAEGFDILKASPYGLDLKVISHLWNQGSVVRSWLLELAENAFAEDPALEKIQGYVEDSGEGRWTILEAMERDVPAPAITLSLFERFHSRKPDSFAARVLAALRNQFGGHAVKRK